MNDLTKQQREEEEEEEATAKSSKDGGTKNPASSSDRPSFSLLFKNSPLSLSLSLSLLCGTQGGGINVGRGLVDINVWGARKV